MRWQALTHVCMRWLGANPFSDHFLSSIVLRLAWSSHVPALLTKVSLLDSFIWGQSRASRTGYLSSTSSAWRSSYSAAQWRTTTMYPFPISIVEMHYWDSWFQTRSSYRPYGEGHSLGWVLYISPNYKVMIMLQISFATLRKIFLLQIGRASCRERVSR